MTKQADGAVFECFTLTTIDGNLGPFARVPGAGQRETVAQSRVARNGARCDIELSVGSDRQGVSVSLPQGVSMDCSHKLVIGISGCCRELRC